MLKKTYFKATGMFLFVGLCVLGFSYSLYGKDKPFEMKLIKEFKTAEEYEMYKKAHLEVFGVKKGEEKRIKVEGDRIRFYDEKGNLIRERRVYQGKEVFEAKDKYGKIEKFRLYSDFYISPKGDLVVEQRWKGPPPPSEEPAWVEKAIIYNGRGEITGEIDSLSIYPFILPESRYIIGISGGEGWADDKVYIYDTKGAIVKTIEFGKEYPDDKWFIENDECVMYVKVSNDGNYALIVLRYRTNREIRFVLINKEGNILWKKVDKGIVNSGDLAVSSFGEYTAFSVYTPSKMAKFELVVFNKKGKQMFRKQVPYATSLHFIGNTRILAYVDLKKPMPTLILLDVEGGNILSEKSIEKIVWEAGIKMIAWNNMLAVGSSTREGEIDKEFGSGAPVYLFQWKASDDIFLKGGGR